MGFGETGDCLQCQCSQENCSPGRAHGLDQREPCRTPAAMEGLASAPPLGLADKKSVGAFLMRGKHGASFLVTRIMKDKCPMQRRILWEATKSSVEVPGPGGRYQFLVEEERGGCFLKAEVDVERCVQGLGLKRVQMSQLVVRIGMQRTSSKLSGSVSESCSQRTMVRDEEAQGRGPAPETGPVSARRYFDALQGPELDVLRDSEDSFILALDRKWPFLLRFPINTFGIVLGLTSQAILWQALASVHSLAFLRIPPEVNLVLWCASLFALAVISTTYLLKCIFYFEAVRREYFHPVRINYFFAPWIGGMNLAIGLPRFIATSVSPAVWCVFMTPLLALELKIYGQWLSGGDRRLSRVANPSTHLSVVGNFVGAVLAAKVGWKEPAMFFWSVGLAHYFVVFVTCYQRLPTNNALPKELHPVFFLFVAAPCTASVAWEGITGNFDRVSRFTYFVALFLLLSLVVRINLFRGIRFSTSWWAYTFPLGAASVATIRYCELMPSTFTRFLAVAFSFAASIVVFIIFLLTVCHGLVWGSLFPNDLAIAITQVKHKSSPVPKLSNGGPTNGVNGVKDSTHQSQT